MNTSNDVNMSRRSQENIAFAMVHQLNTDMMWQKTPGMGKNPEDQISVDDIVSVAVEAKIDAELMASAYFVEAGMCESTRLRLDFDMAFSKAIGSDYAKRFVREVERLVAIEAADKTRRQAPTMGDLKQVIDRRHQGDMKKKTAGKTLN